MNNPNWSRRQVVDDLKDILIFGGLTDSYGVNESKETDKKGKTFYSLTFAKAANLDGVVKVYGSGFILIEWQTRYAHLPHRGKQVCKSDVEAKRFIQRNFVL